MERTLGPPAGTAPPRGVTPGSRVVEPGTRATDPAPGGATTKEVPEMMFLTAWLTSILRREEGQGLAEYALILALIAVVAILALVFLGTQIQSILSEVG